jgi:hypothetical protein
LKAFTASGLKLVSWSSSDTKNDDKLDHKPPLLALGCRFPEVSEPESASSHSHNQQSTNQWDNQSIGQSINGNGAVFNEGRQMRRKMHSSLKAC